MIKIRTSADLGAVWRIKDWSKICVWVVRKCRTLFGHHCLARHLPEYLRDGWREQDAVGADSTDKMLFIDISEDNGGLRNKSRRVYFSSLDIFLYLFWALRWVKMIYAQTRHLFFTFIRIKHFLRGLHSVMNRHVFHISFGLLVTHLSHFDAGWSTI